MKKPIFRRRLTLRLAVLAGVAAGAAMAAFLALSFFSATSPATANTVAAGVIPQGNTPTAAPSPDPNSASVSITFQIVSVGATEISDYAVKRYTGNTNSSAAINGSCSAPSGGFVTCTDTPPADGTWRYTDTGKYNSWSGPESDKSTLVTVDTTAPAVAVTFPADNGNYNPAGWTAGAPIAGTATDATSGIAGASSIQVTIARSSDGFTWNGTSFASGSNSVPATTYSSPNWTLTFPNSNFPADGAYTVSANATDVATNTGTSSTNTFKYDTVDPSVTVTFPADNGNYSPGGWTAGAPIAGTATDATSGIAGASSIQVTITRTSNGFTWNGSAFASGSNTVSATTYDGSSAWTYTFPNGNFPADGTYTVSASATDRANNTGTSATNTFEYDTTAPSVSVTFPADNGNYSPGGWTAGAPIAGTATDATSGIAGASSIQVTITRTSNGFTWNGSAFASGSNTVSATTYDGSSAWTYTFPNGNFPADGTYTVSASATDRANNTGTSATNTFEYDTTAPTVSATVIGQQSGSVVDGFVKKNTGYFVYANVSDGSGAGVQSVTANVNNVTTGSTAVPLVAGSFTSPAGTSYGYRSALLSSNPAQADGAVTYTVNATDNVSNTSTNSGNGSVTFDTTAPTVSATVIGQQSGSVVDGFVKKNTGYFVYANVSDGSGAGVQSVTANVNNVTTGSTAVPLVAGSFTSPAGTSYGYRSALLSSNPAQADGAVTYTVNATDNVSNTSTNSGNGSVTFDTTAPTVSATVIGQQSGSVVDGFVKKNTGYFVYANVSDGSGAGVQSVTANVNNVTTGSTAVPLVAGSFTSPAGTSYGYRSALLSSNPAQADGAVTYTVNATDNVSNTSTNSGNGSVTFDTTAPTVSATVIGQQSGSVVDGFVKKNTGYFVYANVSDGSGAGVQSVTANVNNVTTGSTAVPLVAGSFTSPAGTSYGYRSALLSSNPAQADGAVTYTVNATDNVSNTSTNSGNGSVTFDTTAPTVSATVIGQQSGSVVDGFVKKNTGYFVYANVSDGSGAGVQSVTANVNNVTTGSTAVPLVAGSFTSPAGTSYGYRSALLSSNPAQADGAVTYTVNATDNVSNTSTNSGNGSVTFDTTAPTGTVAASGTSGSINLTGTSVTDGTGSGTASITYYRCTGTGTPCTTTTPISTPANWTSIGTSTTSIGNWPVAWDSTTVANGSYTIMGVLTDKIGNQGASGNRATVTVNNSYTFVVANPGTQTAGTAFGGFTIQLQVNGANSTTYNGVAYTGAKTITFSGPGNAPDGTAPTYPATVSFTNGLATLPAGSITLFRAESPTLAATDSTGSPTITGASTSFTVNPATRVGIVLSSITTPPTPAFTITGAVGTTLLYSSTLETNGTQSSTAKISLADQYRNVVTNSTGSSITIDLSASGQGSVSPTGLSVLTIPNGSSESSASFTLSRDNGNNKSVTLTATVHGTAQILKVTMSS